ncbi:MAG: ATPase [Treponema sp.]|nr:ATPase [Treponema sp.]MBQ2571237.1 ATPase [Treponema sp.]MBR6143367.1 ATPase [Treponema sp.]HBB12883.1 ATPase [Treponema sp.]
MAKTTAMRLLELIVYREDISKVLSYLGNLGEFQFQQDFDKPSSASGAPSSSKSELNPDSDIFYKLEQARSVLGIPELEHYTIAPSIPTEQDEKDALELIDKAESIHEREVQAGENAKRAADTLAEAKAFTNLKVSYTELENLSFLTMRIGKIDPENIPSLKAILGVRAMIVPLGEDKSRVMVASSKKARFMVDTELKNAGFVEIQIPKDFKGIPDDMLESLQEQQAQAEKVLEEVQVERKNFSETHKDALLRCLQLYSFASQIRETQNRLESTEYVYRITGWIPAYLSHNVMKSLDELTESRTGIREFLPSEVASITSGQEQVPVQLKHGKIVSAFERMIFSYGAPLYGTVDPTPFVAIFFTLLFGIMFGDAGQGLVFLLVGILMCMGKMKLMGWEKFSRIFICIGVSSTIMGLLTGEFFANETLLEPFAKYVTGLFGEPRSPILSMMPTGSKESITRMFMFFGFTIAVGFVINTCGLLINIINQFSLKNYGRALFGKTGLSGAVFFWYVIAFALRIAFLKHVPAVYDWIVIGTSLTLTAFCEPLQRIVSKESPVLENGLFSAIIGALVEVIEVFSSYISNTVSFVRVGAFALAHAVLGFLINMMAELAGPGGILVLILGNAIVVVLEGMIVAIQVVRLQYYEFFSKFFTETGREFKPFRFEYKPVLKF